ncbi:MAG: DUF2975 domain-containing protein [Pseudomonadota bacterium]
MRKIQYTSRFFKWVFIIAFIILPITLIVFWYKAPWPMAIKAAHYGINLSYMPKLPPHAHIADSFSMTTKLLGFMISLIPMTINLSVLYLLIRLFNNFERSAIFALKNVRYCRWIGYALFIGQVLNPIHELLLSMAVTWQNPPGERIASLSFSGSNVGILLLALLIILISWIMGEAYKLKDEQRYTV